MLRRAVSKGDELNRTVRERDEARESAATVRQQYHELERAYQKETAEHKGTRDLFIAVQVTTCVLLLLLTGSVLL